MPWRHLRSTRQAWQTTSPSKNYVTSKSPVGDIPVVTLIRTDTTLDHSQKAEKVCHANAALNSRLARVNLRIVKTVCTQTSEEPMERAHGETHLAYQSAPRAFKEGGGTRAPPSPNRYCASQGDLCRTSASCQSCQLGAEAPAKIEGVTLMRPIHSNL